VPEDYVPPMRVRKGYWAEILIECEVAAVMAAANRRRVAATAASTRRSKHAWAPVAGAVTTVADNRDRRNPIGQDSRPPARCDRARTRVTRAAVPWWHPRAVSPMEICAM